MWQAITFFVALPLLYLIGEFYLRVFGWVYRRAVAAWGRLAQGIRKETA